MEDGVDITIDTGRKDVGCEPNAPDLLCKFTVSEENRNEALRIVADIDAVITDMEVHDIGIKTEFEP